MKQSQPVTLPTTSDLPLLLESSVEYLIFTDGSGTKSNLPCGFHSIIYEFSTQTSTHLSCHFTHGSNNFAELMPIVHSLYFLFDKHSNYLKKYRIAIVSDSQVTIRAGARKYVRTNPLWGSIERLEKDGIQLSWLWVQRNSNKFNEFCDLMAGKYRKLNLGDKNESI